MSKQEWQRHCTEVGEHDRQICPACKARVKTHLANERAKAKRDIYESLGLVRVRGTLGGIYYE